MGVAVKGGMVAAADGVGVEADWEQPIVTDRTRAMAIATGKSASERISDADLARIFPHLVCTRGDDNEILRFAQNDMALLADGAAEGGSGAAASEEASVAGFLLESALVEEDLASEKGHTRLAVDLPAFVEGEA